MISLSSLFSLSTCSETVFEDDVTNEPVPDPVMCKSDIPEANSKHYFFFPNEELELSTQDGLQEVCAPVVDKENYVAVVHDGKSESVLVEAPKTRKSKGLQIVDNQSVCNNRKSTRSQKGKRKSRQSRLPFEVYVEECDENCAPSTGMKDNPAEALPGSASLLSKAGGSPETENLFSVKSRGSPSNHASRSGQVSPRKEVDKVIEETAKEIVSDLSSIFPGVDPEFIKSECDSLKAPLKKITESILIYMEKNKQGSENRKACVQRENLEKRFTRNFSAEKFLKIIPDPWKYFETAERKDDSYQGHSIYYLLMKFRKYYKGTIEDSLELNNRRLYLAYKHLMKKNRGVKEMATYRSWSGCLSKKPVDINMQFLLEVAFIENEEALKNYLKNQSLITKHKIKEGMDKTSLLSCMNTNCSFSSSKEDFVKCAAGHTVCKSCATKSIIKGIEEEKCYIDCLVKCKETLPMNTIEFLLTPKEFSKIIELYELQKGPRIENLAKCPFCWFVTIIPQNEKIVSCLNVECLKETCRDCNDINHQPLPCD